MKPRSMVFFLALAGVLLIPISSLAEDPVVLSGSLHPNRIQLDRPEALQSAKTVTGNQPWVTILCRFSDHPETPNPPSHYEELMGCEFPGVCHFWNEVSFGEMTAEGSIVAGWYDLPGSHADYVRDAEGNEGDGALIDFRKLTEDCTSAADADVYFPEFLGIDIVLNVSLGVHSDDPGSFGGSISLTRDGVSKSYGATWLSTWHRKPLEPFVVAHERGHAFGLPHSGLSHDKPYNSFWDVMSSGNFNAHYPRRRDDLFVGVHTIAYHKDLLGWIPPERKYVALPGSKETIRLERLGVPSGGSGYLMAEIPVNNGTFYTIEARRFIGYDNGVTAEAIVIHHIDTAQIVPAAVVNGDHSTDGEAWIPCESLMLENGVKVTVKSKDETGFYVTIDARSMIPSSSAAFARPAKPRQCR